MPNAEVHHRAERASANIDGRRAASELCRKRFHRDWKELTEGRQRFEVGAPVIEHTEDSGDMLEPPTPGFVDEARDRCDVEMVHDLRQVELGGEAVVRDELGLLDRIGVWVRPAAERQPRFAYADLPPQLPRVLDATRAAH